MGDADIIIIAALAASRQANFKAGLTIDGGAGMDTCTPGAQLLGTVTQVAIP